MDENIKQIKNADRGEDVRDAFVKAVQEIDADVPEPITERRLNRIMENDDG